MSCWLGCPGCPDCLPGPPNYTPEELEAQRQRDLARKERRAQKARRKYEERKARRENRHNQDQTPGPRMVHNHKERNMAKGEATYSSAGKTIQRFENKPIPKGDYNLTLLAKGLEIRRSKEKGPDAIPYIGARFAAEGTAAKEGGKDRLVFANFFLSLKPGADGVVMPERQGGIVEFLRANGKELDVGVKTLTKEDGTTESYLDAEAILEMLQEMTDTTTPAYVTIEAGRDPKGSDDRNKVSYWGAKETEEAEEEEAPAPKAAPGKKAALPGKKK